MPYLGPSVLLKPRYVGSVREGIDAALAKGEDSPFKGRPKSIDDDKVKELYAELGSKVAVADKMGISRQSVWRALR